MSKTKTKKEIFEKIDEVCSKSKTISIITHVNPDGDAVGSSLGLYHFLVKKKKKVNIITPNDFPEFLKWLPESDKIIRFDEDSDKAIDIISKSELIFFLDFNDVDRVPNIRQYIEESKAIKVLIDHHPQPTECADVLLSDTEVSSTAELVCDFMLNTNKALLDIKIAECLFTGILTDTISFMVNSHRPKTFHVAAELMNLGVDRDIIHDRIFNNFSENRMRLLGHVLNNRMNVMPGFKTAYLYLSKEDQKKYSFEMGDSEGFVNYPLSIKGIVFTAFFMEKKDHVKISFRSKGENKINEIAVKYFNGGGHRNAAGGESKVSLEDTISKFVKVLPELLKSNNIHV